MAASAPKDGRPQRALRDRVVVVSVAEPAAAVALAAEGAAVVVVGSDAEATGRVVRTLTEAGHRASAFVGDASTDASALAEMVAELFPERESDTPEPA